MPAATRCWRQRPQTAAKPSSSTGDGRAKRVVVAPPAPRAVAAVAASLPASSWSQRTVAEGPQGPMGEALARTRVTLWQDGLPERTVGLVSQRTVGVHKT